MTPATIAMKVGALAATGIVVGRVVYALANAPSRTATTTGLRGLKRQRALAESELWARVEPLVRWLGHRIRGLVTDDLRASIDHKLMLAGDYAGLTAEELVALSILTGIAGTALGALIAWLSGVGEIVTILFGIIGPTLPWMRVSDAANTRLASIKRNLPFFIDLMALSIGAGLDFPGAIRRLVEKASDPDDPIVEEFSLILQSLQLGRTRRAALEEFAERAPLESVREFTNTIIQAEEQGTSIGAALQILAGMARLKRSIEGEEKAAKAGVKMLGPLGLMFLALLMLIVAPAVMTMKDLFK